MANIAQIVNVLQAMILTQGEKMILTPTYHVFDMYKVHQDATLLPTDLQCSEYRFADDAIGSLSASASRDKFGYIHISLCNLDPKNSAEIVCELRGTKAETITGQLLTAPAINSHNTFENPEVVKPVAFEAATLKKNKVHTTLPAKSIVVLKIK